MKVARPQRCCGASWLPVSASESILSPGSKIFSPALPIIPLTGSPNFCPTTGHSPRPDRQELLAAPDRFSSGSPGDSQPHTLTQIESVFRSLKSELGIRPIYHQLEHRADAHVFIAFLAYCLQVTLKNRLLIH